MSRWQPWGDQGKSIPGRGNDKYKASQERSAGAHLRKNRGQCGWSRVSGEQSGTKQS